jgi:hypothetical protein
LLFVADSVEGWMAEDQSSDSEVRKLSRRPLMRLRNQKELWQ